MNLLVLEHRFVSGWPHNDDDRAGLMPAHELLTTRFDTDVHFVAYDAKVERRHTKWSLDRADEAQIAMQAIVFDVDGPGHQGTDEWWEDQQERIGWLLDDHPEGFVYRTRGGYRVVFVPEQPFPIRSPEDAAEWTRHYLTWLNYLKRAYGIEADTKCKDWQHLYRAPHATRDGVLQELPTIGDPHAIGVWSPALSAEDWTVEPAQSPSSPPDARGPGAGWNRTPVAAMLGAAWPEQGRHTAQLALAGALYRDGWKQEDALEFLCDVCRHAGNEERPKREQTIRDTWVAGQRGVKLPGWSALQAHVPVAVVSSARDMLDPKLFGYAEFAELMANVPTSTASPTPNDAPKRIAPAARARRIGGRDLARLKTGIVSIDTATRGGILLKKLGVIGGAPGAGKTALLCKLAFGWVSQGIPVGILASDEDADALLIRLGQLVGLSRDDLENGDPAARDALAQWCESVPLILADGDEENATIESVSRDLRTLAGTGPSVLLVDSMQTARTESELPKGADLRTRVNDVVRVLKRTAKADGHLVLASSELSKAAYRNKSQSDNINALSAFKESGDIEYGVSFAMVLVTAQGTNDLVEATVAKNRLGPGKPTFLLKLDHTTADICETSKEEQEIRDPLYFKKVEIMAEIEASAPVAMSRRLLVERVGGARETVLAAVRALLNEHKLTDAKEGVRLPLPGEPGYGPNNHETPTK